MRAILIRQASLRSTWTDTGIRTTTPDRIKREVRQQNPGLLVLDVAESDVAKMTGVL